MKGVFYHRGLSCWCTRNSNGDVVALHENQTKAKQMFASSDVDNLPRPAAPRRDGAAVNLSACPPPKIPRVFYPFTAKVKAAIPSGPGVYVAVDSDMVCKYIGKAKNLRERLLSKHLGINRKHDMVSWIEAPLDRIDYLECYLIGMLAPYNNFTKKPQYRHVAQEASYCEPVVADSVETLHSACPQN